MARLGHRVFHAALLGHGQADFRAYGLGNPPLLLHFLPGHIVFLGADEREDLAGRYAEGDMIDGGQGPKPTRQVARLDDPPDGGLVDADGMCGGCVHDLSKRPERPAFIDLAQDRPRAAAYARIGHASIFAKALSGFDQDRPLAHVDFRQRLLKLEIGDPVDFREGGEAS